MANMFGKLGYGGNIGPYKHNAAAAGEMPFDQIEDNITTHYNEQVKINLRTQITGVAPYNPNGGLCNDVKQSG